jgi:hypothetical protein
VIDTAKLSAAFSLESKENANSERDNSDPISEAFVQVLFLGSERLNGRRRGHFLDSFWH